MSYLATLGATLVVELVVAAGLFRGRPPKDLMLVVLCANLLTHPIASFILQGPWYGLEFWPIEYLVLLTEFAIYKAVAGLKITRAAVLAIATNACTIALSLIVFL